MQPNTLCETLESRRLLSVSLSDGILLVQGTTADDEVNIYRTVDDVVVDLNGNEDRFPAGQVGGILVDTGFGADTIILSRTLQIRSQLKGGRGNDSISGGDNRDVIYGEGGDDYIYGGGGNDVLDPGAKRTRSSAAAAIRTSSITLGAPATSTSTSRPKITTTANPASTTAS
jgi:Ca2+-binding RTX toxin-like protein